MKKALIVATVSGFVPQFEMNNVRLLQSMGYEVHYAANYSNPVYGADNTRLDGTGIIMHQIDFVRSPFRLMKNLVAYRQLKNILKKGKFSLIHCHTPMGGTIGRLACSKYRKRGIKVIYTAHGFHFYKGAPLSHWILFYPIELLLSYITDVLIVINEEDYKRALKFKAKRLFKIPGPGLEYEKYNKATCDRIAKRQSLGIPEDAFVLVSVGEVNTNKNHIVVLNALALLLDKNIYYVICGIGENETELRKTCDRLCIEERVKFIGYREDVPEILKCSDCYVMPSIREGLGMAAIEAMAAGLPIICSNNRGAREFCVDGKSGYICKLNTPEEFSDAISKIFNNKELSRYISGQNIELAKKYDTIITKEIMSNVYSSI